MSKDGFIDKLQQAFCYEAVGRYFEELENTSYRSGFTKIAHYTDTSVLDSLLSKGVMWATNIFYLNDNVEYKAGIDVLRKTFADSEKIIKLIDQLNNDNGYNWPGIFIMSFSSEPDELQQWITYGKDSGVSIEFDTEKMTSQKMWVYQRYASSVTSGDSSSDYYDSSYRRFYEITYINPKDTVPEGIKKTIIVATAKLAEYTIGLSDYGDQNCQFECALCANKNSCWLDDTRYAQYMKDFLKLLTTYYKSKVFYGEHEIRASFIPAKDGIDEKEIRSEILHVRKDNGMLRPYMEIIFGNTPYDGDMEPKPTVPIKAITVGPSGIQDKLYESVVHRVKYGDTRALWFDDEPYLKKHIEEYLDGVTSVDGSDYPTYQNLGTAEYLLSMWNHENGKAYGVEKDTEGRFKLLVSSAARDFESTDWEDTPKPSELTLRYNYLSRHGIWVKKSVIEYIF